MYLLDTNIWLERLLNQERSEEVARFLARISTDHILMSDFSLHSIGVILGRFGQHDVLIQFVEDLFMDGGICLVSVAPASMHLVVGAMNRFNLDFDDAYQYIAAEQNEAGIVSFDRDFDRTENGARTPADILTE